MEITEPGMYLIPEADYHADPVPGGSLSSTVARRILPPGCPALVRWETDHPVHKDCYDLGSVAHRLVLGVGCDIVEVEYDSWQTKAAKAERDAARERGAVALLSKDLRAAEAMAAAVMAHPDAGALFAPGAFTPEATLVWHEDDTDVWCRAMVDAYPVDGPGRPILADLKTTDSADLASVAKSVATYGYHQQADWYLRGAECLGLPDARFVFVFVEKKPPHLVTVVELDDETLDAGARLNVAAIDAWLRCRDTGHWPGHATKITTIGLPKWARKDTL